MVLAGSWEAKRLIKDGIMLPHHHDFSKIESYLQCAVECNNYQTKANLGPDGQAVESAKAIVLGSAN
jgi:hypothetical protein